MVNPFLPASFTKNLGLGRHPDRLYRAIRDGFGGKSLPVERETWRQQSGLPDRNRELIVLNFFLYCKKGLSEDFVVCDTLVEEALARPFDTQFSKLSVFALHLASSGDWHGSEAWPTGSLTGWANLLVRNVAWNGNDWLPEAFERKALLSFISSHVAARANTRQKIRNNYHFMLRRSGILIGKSLEDMDYNSPWLIKAPQLFWDRKIFEGRLSASSTQDDFEGLFVEEEVYKLMRCSKDQGLATAKGAFREYSKLRLKARLEQLDSLRPALARAA